MLDLTTLTEAELAALTEAELRDLFGVWPKMLRKQLTALLVQQPDEAYWLAYASDAIVVTSFRAVAAAVFVPGAQAAAVHVPGGKAAEVYP